MEITESFILETTAEYRTLVNGMAIGVVQDGETRSFFHGWTDSEKLEPIDEDTQFEIGSLTKPFTSLLLADLSVDSRLGLDDTVGSFVADCPDHVRGITLRQLCLHRSGLPRLPSSILNLPEEAYSNPYRDYAVTDLFNDLADVHLSSKSSEDYSNFGYGLLGHLLGRKSGSNYLAEIESRILKPLGMDQTGCRELDNQNGATPHEFQDHPVERWEFQDSMVAAGGLRSNLKDMLKFLEANLIPQNNTQLEAAIRTSQELQIEDQNPIKRLLVAGGKGVILGLASWIVTVTVPVLPGNFWFALVTLLPMLVSSWYLGWFGGCMTTAVITSLLWCYPPPGIQVVQISFDYLIICGLIFSVIRFDFFGSENGRSLGWFTRKISGRTVQWHNGMVGGCASYMAFEAESQTGVVILVNTALQPDLVGESLMKAILKGR